MRGKTFMHLSSETKYLHQPQDFDLLTNFDGTLFNTASDNSPASLHKQKQKHHILKQSVDSNSKILEKACVSNILNSKVCGSSVS